MKGHIMKKVQTKNKLKGFFGLFAAFAMAIGVGVSLAPKETLKTSAAVEQYEEVKSTLADWSGEYLIVSKANNLAFDGSLAAPDGNGNSVAVTISSGKISLDSKYSVTLEKNGANYDIKTASGKYIYGKDGDANGMDSNSNANTIKNAISYDSSGVAIIKSTGTNSNYLVYNATSDQLRFRFFKSSTSGAGKGSGNYKGVSLFKKSVASSSVVTTLAVNPTSKSLLTTAALVASDYTVSITKDGVAGSSADYTAKIGTGTGGNFSGEDIVWGTTLPKVSDTTIQFKAKHPNASGGSTYLTAEVALTVTEPVFGTLSSIAIKTQATKLSFEVGEIFSREGLVITASDNSNPVISKDLTSGFSTDYDGITFVTDDIGTKTVTISYTEGATKTVTYSITVTAFVPIHKFSAKGFGGYEGAFDLVDHTGTVGSSNTTIALRVVNGGTGQIRGNQSGIANNFSMRNIDIYPGYIRKIVIKGTGGTFKSSTTRSLVNVGNSAYTIDNASTGTKIEGVLTGGTTLTWTIPENVEARYFILHNLEASGTMLAAADDAIQIFYDVIPDTFGTLDHITLDTSSSMLKKTFFVGEALVTTGLLVTAFDTTDKDLIMTEYTTTPTVGYNFLQSDVGVKSIDVTVNKGGISKSSSYNVEVLTSRTYTKLSGSNDIRYNQIYALGTATGAASTSIDTFASEVGINYNIESDSFSSVTNLQLVTLGIGAVKGSYSIQLLNGSGQNKYYSWLTENTLILSDEVNQASSWYITFTSGTLEIKTVNDSGRFLGHNQGIGRISTYVGSPAVNASLFMDFASYDAEAEAMTFADAVNTGIGNNANKSCHAAYDFLSDVYSRLSVPGKVAFDTNNDIADIENARNRMAYLSAWTAANAGKPDGKVASPAADNNSLTATIIIGVIGLTTLAGYYFLQKKKEA